MTLVDTQIPCGLEAHAWAALLLQDCAIDVTPVTHRSKSHILVTSQDEASANLVGFVAFWCQRKAEWTQRAKVESGSSGRGPQAPGSSSRSSLVGLASTR